jgi:hypothetical protein
MTKAPLIFVAVALGVGVGLFFATTFDGGHQLAPDGTIRDSKGSHVALSGNTSASASVDPQPAASPPRFLTKQAVPVQNDPTQPDYDPVQLSAVGHSFQDIFKAEPRNRRWASAIEHILDSRLAGDLPVFSGEAKIAGIECHTSSCEVKVDAPFDDVHRVTFGLQYPPLGDAFSPSVEKEPIAEGRHRHTLLVLFRPQSRELSELEKQDRERRRLGLEIIKTAPQRMAELGIDPSRFPPLENSP